MRGAAYTGGGGGRVHKSGHTKQPPLPEGRNVLHLSLTAHVNYIGEEKTSYLAEISGSPVSREFGGHKNCCFF